MKEKIFFAVLTTILILMSNFAFAISVTGRAYLESTQSDIISAKQFRIRSTLTNSEVRLVRETTDSQCEEYLKICKQGDEKACTKWGYNCKPSDNTRCEDILIECKKGNQESCKIWDSSCNSAPLNQCDILLKDCKQGNDASCTKWEYNCKPSEVVRCKDTDGGQNYYQKGKTYSSDDPSRYNEDYCSNEKLLMEQYCSPGGLSATTFECSEGCKGGTCIKNQPQESCGDGICTESENKEICYDVACTCPEGARCECPPKGCQKVCPQDCEQNTNIECVDTDGGENYYSRGTTKGCNGNGKGACNEIITMQDYCVSSTNSFVNEGPKISEYYCGDSYYYKNKVVMANQYACPNGCKDGACLKTSQDAGKISEVAFTPAEPPDSVKRIDSAAINQRFGVYGNVEYSSERHYVEYSIPLGCYFENTEPSYGIGGKYDSGSSTRKVFENSPAHNFKFLSFNCQKSGKYEFYVRLLDKNYNIIDAKSSVILIGQSETEKNCDELQKDYQKYFDICAESGYQTVCFDKYDGAYKGCTDLSGKGCTYNNVQEERNIICKVTNANKCIDDDGGKNYNVKGGANYDYPGQGACGYVDYCEGNILYETICSSDFECPSHINYKCPNGCKDGKCIETSSGDICKGASVQDTMETGQTKTYTSGSKDYEVTLILVSDTTPPEAKFIVNDEVTASLSANQVYELKDGVKFGVKEVLPTKTGNTIMNLAEFCIFGQSTPSTCKDTDGGKNLYAKGIITGDQLKSEDYCLGYDNILYEFYCRDWSTWDQTHYDMGVSGNLNIPFEIYGKKIIPVDITSTSVKFRIDDTIGTVNVGSASEIGNTGIVIKVESVKVNDATNSNLKSVEYGVVNKFYSQYNTICPNGCQDGACVQEPSSNACKDSDGGKNIFEAGYTKGQFGGTVDNCNFLGDPEYGVMNEAVCENGQPSFVTLPCPKSAPYCRFGVCTEKNLPICTDSDDGIIPTIKGTIKEARYADGPSHIDYCESLLTFQPTDQCEGKECGLREYYCPDPYYTTSYSDIPCPEGCRDGQCLGNFPAQCRDSDGGMNYNEKGTIISTDETKKTDYCETRPGTLVEYYCLKDGSSTSTVYTCSDGCKDGKCVGDSTECDELLRECKQGNEKACSKWEENCKPHTECDDLLRECKQGNQDACIKYKRTCTPQNKCDILLKECKQGDESACKEWRLNCNSYNPCDDLLRACKKEDQEACKKWDTNCKPSGNTKCDELLKLCKLGDKEACIKWDDNCANSPTDRCDEYQKECKNGNEEACKKWEANCREIIIDTKENVEVLDDKIYVNKKEVKVMPDVASEKAIQTLRLRKDIASIQLKDTGKPIYEIVGRKDVRVLGMVKAEMPVKTEIDATNGEIEKTDKPWWSILATD